MTKTVRECAKCGGRRGLAGRYYDGRLLCWKCMIGALQAEHWDWDIHSKEAEHD